MIVTMDLKVIGIRNAGESSERLLIRVENDCNLRGYMVVDNTYDENGQLSNVDRHVYVFPSHEVKKGNIVRLYTRRGIDKETDGTFGKTESVKYYNFYWGYDDGCTVWNKDGDTPYILHFDKVFPIDFK